MTTTKPSDVRQTITRFLQSLWQDPRQRSRKTRNSVEARSVDRLEDRLLLSAIHGQKYEDLNANGLHESGEPGLNGWTIYLFNGSGNIVTTATTQDMDLNSDNLIDPETERGLYWFTGLPDGSYTVGEELKPGWLQTDPPSPALAGIGPGFDLFVTDPATTWADLDGPGGLPQMPFVGLPIHQGFFPVGDGFGGNVDTIVERRTGLDPLPIGGTGTVEIELVALQLRSVQPIDLGGTLYNIEIQAGSLFNIPQQTGQMTINRDSELGGTFQATLPVDARMYFFEVGNLSNFFVQQFSDVFLSESVWSTRPGAGDPRTVDPDARELYPSGNLYAGINQPDECQGTKVLTEEQAMLAAHGVLPAMLEELVAPRTRIVTITGGAEVLGVDFGNAAKGSIHGYKFEDINVNGVNDDTDNNGLGEEPRIEGVTVTLNGLTGSGQTIGPLTVTTDANGEYWFSKLTPGRYTVTETPLAGTFATTPTSFTFDLLSRQELVAELGQSDVNPSDPNDPRVEVVIGPTLAFGNAFEGSIHGYKFHDLNGNGIDDDTNGDGIGDEPRWAGVTVLLTWVDQLGFAHRRRTTTNRDGEFWFSWLEPGLTYTVAEIPPYWSEQTTVRPAPITILSGHEWIAAPWQAGPVQRAVSFPWWWQVVVDPEPMNGIDPPPEMVMLQGMAMVGFSEGINVQNPTGPAFPIVDGRGLPLDLPDGQWSFDTEIVSMDLRGHDSLGREVILQLDEARQSLGQVVAQANQGDNFMTGDSFFDIFFEIDIVEPGSQGDAMTLTPDGSVRVGMTFTDNNQHPVPQRIPRKDVRWLPAFFWAEGLGRDLLDDAGRLWDKLISIHAVPHVEIEKPVLPVLDPDLAFGNAIHSSIHGYKFEDLNLNGIDDDINGDGIGDEPRIGGVDIDLAGDTDGNGSIDYTFVTRTDARGEYWFTDLLPGVYTVSETPPFGSFPTTPVSFTVTLFSGQELVAQRGQAMLGASDPQVEIVIGPALAFGNAYEGSIHGYKFRDINADGVWQRGVEPTRSGVSIQLWTVNEATGAEQLLKTTVTDTYGEYWFTWLQPGLVYQVREIIPAGSRQTTPNPGRIKLLSGQEWVATPEQGRAAQLTFGFPWWWQVEVDPVPDPDTGNDLPPLTVMLGGMAEISTSELLDPATGQVIRPLADQLGRALPLLPGDNVMIETEIVSLSLHSAQPVQIGDSFFDIFIEPAKNMPQRGVIRAQYQQGIGPADEDGLVGDSFFDVFFDITIVDINTRESMTLAVADDTDPTQRAAVQIGMVFGANNPDPVPVVIPPKDIRWMPTFFWLTGQPRELRQVLPDGTLGDLWDELISIHAHPHSEHEKAVRPVINPDLAFGNQFPPTIHGRKFSDLNANGARDAREPYLNGWTIELVDESGTVVATTLTMDMDIDGNGTIENETESGWYWLTAAVPGKYSVREVLKPGWTATAPNLPTDPVAQTAFDLDQERGLMTTGKIFENWGGLGEKWMFGNKTGAGWYYILPNGELYRWNGSPRTALTGTLVATLDASYHTDPAKLYNAQPVPRQYFYTVNVSAEDTLEGLDFGNFTPAASIHGRKFHDLDGSGTWNAGEPYLNGWTIELVDANSNVVATTTTMDMDLNGDLSIDPDTERGWYWLTDIGLGDYTVREVPQAGWQQSSAGSGVAARAYALDQQRGLVSTGKLFANWGNLGEKWMYGTATPVGWYYILANGEVYRWNGSPRTALTGTLVETLDPSYHADPSLLYNAQRSLVHAVKVVTGLERFDDRNFGNALDAIFPGLAESGFDE